MRLPVTTSFKSLSSRKSTFVSILDIGTSKIVCLIAELRPTAEPLPSLKRTHSIRLLGIGHHRAAGVKGGVIVDLDAAEQAIRNAIDAAENMSKVEIKSVLVTLTGGDLTSHRVSTHEMLRKGVATATDVQKILAQAELPWATTADEMLLHIFPTDFTLDSQFNIANPIGMVGSTLSANSHIITADSAAARNLILAVERCHVDVEAIVATPYASGLATLLDDEMTPGSIVLDMGGGTTSFCVFLGGRCMHVDSIPIGGQHVTGDITHGLSIGFSAAERLKTLYGSAIASDSDMRESLVIRRSSEDSDEGVHYIQRSELVRIIRPRLEEIFEIISGRINALGCSLTTGWSLILTGGASQLSGVADVASRILAPEKRVRVPDGSYTIVGGARVRIGRPLGVRGLTEEAKGPAFAASVGMLVYPQVLHKEYKEDNASLLLNAYTGGGGEKVLARVGRWIRENF